MPSHEYLTAINKAKSTGIRVLGYVHTSYGTRSQTDVKSDIDKYKAWYNVSDIFLDEASGQTADLSYYQHLADYIHTTAGAIVMLNFGIYPDESYMNIGDIANVFENTYSAYPTAQIPSWAFKYPPTKFSHLIYGSNRSAMTHVLALAQQRNVGYIYVTDGVLPNPWNTLPSYWSSETIQLYATCIHLSAGVDQARQGKGLRIGLGHRQQRHLYPRRRIPEARDPRQRYRRAALRRGPAHPARL